MTQLSSHLATAVLKKLSATVFLIAAMALPSFGQTLLSISANPPALTVAVGSTHNVQIVGYYSDGSVQDLTSAVSWTSSDPAAVSVTTAQPQISVLPLRHSEMVTLTATYLNGTQALLANMALNVLPFDDPTIVNSIQMRGGNSGIPPFSTFAGGGADSLNLATDNILLSIPIRSKNEAIPFNFTLVGNSHAVNESLGGVSRYWVATTSITGAVSGLFGSNVLAEDITTTCHSQGDTTYNKYFIVDDAGTMHAAVSNPMIDEGVTINGVLVHCHPGSISKGTVNDNSGLTFDWSITNSSGTIYDKHGNVMSGGVLTDKNGNTMHGSADGKSIIDSEGANVLTIATGVGTGGLQDTYTYTDFNGNPQTYTVTYKAYTNYTNFGCGGIDQQGNGIILPYSVTLPKLPNDSAAGQYIFTYEPVSNGVSGRLASITYPTGGKTTYSYTSNGSAPINCADELTVPILTRTTTDTTSGVASKWVYTNTAGVNSTTLNERLSILDPANNTTTYNFSNSYATEQNVSGIEDTYVCYNGATGKSACVTPSSGIYNSISQEDVYSSEANGATNTYNHHQTLFAGPLVTTQTSWNFTGTNARAQTNIAYETINGDSSLPSSVQLVDPTSGSNVQEALTTFNYNSKGNLTQKSAWVSAANYLVTQYTPYGNGTVEKITDPNGTVTTLHYDGSCASLVPTSFTNSVNNLLSSVVYDYDCSLGVVRAQTPVSGFQSYQTYGDPWLRQDTTTDEAGNVITTSYRLNSITTTEPFNTGTLKHIKTFDSLGRVVNSQTDNGSGYDTVQTKYDNMGRVSFISSPFTCSTIGNCSSTTGTSTTYDSAGRVHTVTDANGGVLTYAYTVTTNPYVANVFTSTLTPTPSNDQSLNGKSRALAYDGLGRLISVCEINTFGDAGTCAMSITPQGYVTNYYYNAAGQITSTSQGGVQTRQFSYDGLGRLTYENNPENGATSYNFDGDTSHCNGYTNKKGDLASIVRQNGSFTCFNHDGLHRQITAVDSDGFNRSFNWDSVTIVGINGGNPVGQKGKIAEAYTCNDSVCNTGLVTDEGFTYDSRGNHFWTYQKSPHSGGWYGLYELYNAIGGLDTLDIGSPNLQVTAYDAEGRPTEMDDVSGIGALAKSANYGPFGLSSVTYGSGDQDSFSYDSLGHMTLYKFTAGSNYYQGSLNWNQNGTLHTLTTTDTIPGNGGGSGYITTYHYDDLGRLMSANDGGHSLSQTYTLDRFGNLATNGAPFSWNPPNGYNSNNQYNASGSCSSGIQYDGDGNLLCDTFHTYSWDAADRLKQVDSGSPIIYDAFDAPVEKAGVELLQIPGFGANEFFSMNGQTPGIVEIPLIGGKAIYSGGVLTGYMHLDWNGAARLETTQAQGLYSQAEYSPFGEGYDRTPSSWLNFNDSSQVSATGEYDAANRNLNATQGRWIQPDPAGLNAVNPADPQSWNRYAYAGNNPLSFRDPSGLSVSDCTTPGDNCTPGNGASTGDSTIHVTVNCGIKCTPDVGMAVIGPASGGGAVPNELEYRAAIVGQSYRNAFALLRLDRFAQRAQPIFDAFSFVLFVKLAGPEDLTEPYGDLGFERPVVTDPRLQNIINKLYQPTDQVAGGTAGAVRFEKATGQMLSPAGHEQDAADTVRQLDGFLRNNPGLSSHDQAVAKEIIRDLQSAGAGNP